MVDSPVIFKRTKRKAGQRTRDASPDHAEITSMPADGGEESPITLASKLKNKVKRTQPKSRLSFGGDDEGGDGEVFAVKKSNLSRKLALGTHPANALPTTLDQATISSRSNGAPVYDQAYLSELKASTLSTRRPVASDSHDGEVSMDIEDVSTTVIDVFPESESVIPSESSITAAKQRRERLRASGPEEDFISLSVTRRSDISQGPHPESRLMREEDELGEGEDEFAEYTSAQERIALGKKSKKVEAAKRKDAMQEMIADAEEQDEETAEWEIEQLRRGGHTGAASVETTPAKQIYKPAPIPPSSAIPNLGSAVDRLAQTLTSLTVSHAKNTSAGASLADEREQVDTREAQLRNLIDKSEHKRSWFVAFREWIESVATFLDEKFPKLEKLEHEYLSMLKERSDMINQRRQADDADDLSLVFGSLSPARSSDPEEIDDLGRVVPRANPETMRRERRIARLGRHNRRQIRAAQKETDVSQEGYSTDSSLSPSDASDYQTALQRIADDAESILDDVRAEEFKNPNLGLGKWFGEWRDRFGDSYTGAWGGLGLIGAWEFWVRLELLGWNPLETPKNLDEFAWYSSLYNYSRPHADDMEDGESDLGPDGDLVSAMLSTAVVPHICKMVDRGALNPYSDRDIRRMIDLAEQVEASIGTDNHKFQMILKSVHTAIENVVVGTESLLAPFIAYNQPTFDPETIGARQRFLFRQTKLLENTVRWRKYAGREFGDGELCVRLVRTCVLPVANTGWEVGGEERIHQIMAILPHDLVTAVKSQLPA
ncbi:nineteen complex-related protein 2-domain-containing protein [Hygrophoropsis aurantiaca]|uniref:Nineteen complex-related protein 2-domain-containing protein n=1 Tax=Hygrophoropsis aurantiaca TaxID=72124 RepID=A0ACB8ANI0_9AGAM|nr:nineteen complex-related protein 2-domain-containing protein [Hygrophoropsis aurantiaca]